MNGPRNLWQIVGRAPLAWLFLPFLGGLVLSQYWPGAGSGWIVPGVAGCLWLAWRHADKPIRWIACFLVSALALGAWWGTLRLPADPPVWVEEPLRERAVEVRVERLFVNDPAGRGVSGLGRVVSVSPGLRRNTVEGQLVYLRTRTDSLWLEGAVYEVYGVLRPLDREHPGLAGFDRYLVSQQVVARIDGQRLAFRSAHGERIWQVAFSELRQRAKQSLSMGEAGREDLARVYRAMLLGERLDLTPAQKKNFRLSGTAHLFAISGLHVGIIAGILFGVLNLFRLGEGTRWLLGMLLLGFYVLLTGAPPSAQRAYLMVLCLWGGRLVNRGYAGGSALFASAFAVTLLDPRQPFMLGFQLSYAVVFAILIYGVPLAEAIRNRLQPDAYSLRPERLLRRFLRYTAMSFAISLGAFLGSAPFMIWRFEIFPIAAVVLNVPLLPLAGLTLAFGVLSIGAGFFGLGGLSWLLNHGAWPVIDAMQVIIGTGLATLPVFSGIAFRSEALGIVLMAGLLACGLALSVQRNFPGWLLGAIPLVLAGLLWWAT